MPLVRVIARVSPRSSGVLVQCGSDDKGNVLVEEKGEIRGLDDIKSTDHFGQFYYELKNRSHSRSLS